MRTFDRRVSKCQSARIVSTRSEWQSLLGNLTETHLLQSWDWGELKTRHGWKVRRLLWERSDKPVAAAQIMERTIRSPGLKAGLMYVPRGPLLDWEDRKLLVRVLRDLTVIAHQSGVQFIKIDPEVPVGYGVPDTEEDHPDQTGADVSRWLSNHGWRKSSEEVQFRNTSLLDLTCSEDKLLASFKPKTRYNIRLAVKRGATVRAGDLTDINLLHSMYAVTSARDGFAIRSADYYRDVWGSFIQAGLAQPLIAEVAGIPVAAAIIFSFGKRSIYNYGMSRNIHRDKMPNHLLQWEAIRWAKTQGCTLYDFWGAPDFFDESDPMWGVWRFKAGFRGTVLRTIGAWDMPINRFGYKIYSMVMPTVLRIMRRRGSYRISPRDS